MDNRHTIPSEIQAEYCYEAANVDPSTGPVDLTKVFGRQPYVKRIYVGAAAKGGVLVVRHVGSAPGADPVRYVIASAPWSRDGLFSEILPETTVSAIVVEA